MSLPLSTSCRVDVLSTAPLPTSTDPVFKPISAAQSIDPTSAALEHILALLARLETRIDDQDRRIADYTPSSTPNPDPPNGLLQLGQTSFGMPKILSTAAVGVSIPSLDNDNHSDHLDYVPKPPLVFRPPGSFGGDVSAGASFRAQQPYGTETAAVPHDYVLGQPSTAPQFRRPIGQASEDMGSSVGTFIFWPSLIRLGAQY